MVPNKLTPCIPDTQIAAKALRKQLVDEENASLRRESSAVVPESSEEDPLLVRTNSNASHQAVSSERNPVFRLITRGRMLTTLFVAMVDVIQWTALETVSTINCSTLDNAV